MKNKMFIIFLTITVLVGICGSANATELKTTLNVIQQASETKYLENDQGYISKTIIDSNAETGEVTIRLNVSNLPKETTTQIENYENTEVFIIIPENLSAEENVEKFTQYSNYIETFATKLFAKNSKIKIGIIGMQGPINDTSVDDEGKYIVGSNDEGTKKGKENDAEIVVNLTNDINTIKKGLQDMNKDGTKYYNNLQAAINLSAKSFSKDVNKILISLYDTVPETAIGQCMQVTYGGSTGYSTIEEAVIAKNTKLVEYTKNEVLALKDSNIDFILLRPEDTDFDQKWYNTNTGELILDFDGSKYIKELYGTIQNPTYGIMYSLSDLSLEKIVTENIYEDIIEKIRQPISSIKLVDYFPKEIIDNFDFEYVEKPSIGEVTDNINTRK